MKGRQMAMGVKCRVSCSSPFIWIVVRMLQLRKTTWTSSTRQCHPRMFWFSFSTQNAHSLIIIIKILLITNTLYHHHRHNFFLANNLLNIYGGRRRRRWQQAARSHTYMGRRCGLCNYRYHFYTLGKNYTQIRKGTLHYI